MARKKGDAHGGGHGWFVTFADLMGLLMSFFVMLVAFSAQDQKKLQIVAGSMRDAFGVQRESRFAGVVELDGIPTRPNLKNVRQAPPEEGSAVTAPTGIYKGEDGTEIAKFDRGFALAAASLRQALQDMPEIAELSKNIIIEETREGLNIAIVDQDGRSMFADGSTAPYERTRRLLEKIAPVLRRMPNRIVVTGHTSAARPGSRPGWSAWDLSSGRAGAVREILASNGLPDDRFAAITGKADTEPAFPDNPYLAANRRVNILLLNEAPPLPPGARP
ncbi:flagellar motor protein MotB [Chelatococcus sp. SYSU_G07232]|uniref:Flagellar motor protein MotB n=1 Tax=Chelatococcus albus TaxID=3047466 RepID=A0ABT7ADF9_9HYPH|nr:flagellar motor protein MotB [Chelatococcus sp. SYSU_G07232]MDJ1157415.1 flagellar motor protein MotB [Chelatococcus sp. SYSU_G07232]